MLLRLAMTWCWSAAPSNSLAAPCRVAYPSQIGSNANGDGGNAKSSNACAFISSSLPSFNALSAYFTPCHNGINIGEFNVCRHKEICSAKCIVITHNAPRMDRSSSRRVMSILVVLLSRGLSSAAGAAGAGAAATALLPNCDGRRGGSGGSTADCTL